MCKNILRDNKFARVPKSIAENSLNIHETFGSLSDVVRELIVFLSKKQEETMFNDVVFTIDEFAKANSLSVKELQRKLPKELRQRIVGEAEAKYTNETGIVLLENSFELAMWLATNRNLMMHRRGKDNQFIYEGVQVFKRFEIGADFSSNKRQKKRYLVELNSAYKRYLIDDYNLVNYELYSLLPNISAYRNFFLFFSKIVVITRFRKKKGEEAKFVITIDELCQVFNVQRSNNYEKKRIVIKTLDGVLASVGQKLFEYEFIKNGNRYAYHVLFDMTNIDLEVYDEGKVATFFAIIFERLKKEFIDEVFAHVPHMQRHIEFKKKYEDSKNANLSKDYYEWVFSAELDDERTKLFKGVFFEVFGVPYDDVEERYFHVKE